MQGKYILLSSLTILKGKSLNLLPKDTRQLPVFPGLLVFDNSVNRDSCLDCQRQNKSRFIILPKQY